MKTKISGVYKITNNITGDCYIGSSKNIKYRWTKHKCPSTWKNCPNNPLYLDMQKYGLNNFKFEIIEETIGLREREQYWIDQLNPSYNNYRANGQDVVRYRNCRKEYQRTEKYKNINKKYMKKYSNQLCLYKGETLTLKALGNRFYKQGIPYPFQNAKNYLLKNKQ